MIFKNDYAFSGDTYCFYLNESENVFNNISAIPLVSTSYGTMIDYRDLSELAENYDISEEDAANIIAESNNISVDDLILSLDEADVILDPEAVTQFSSFIVRPASPYSEQALLVEAFFDEFENTGNEDILDILEENFEALMLDIDPDLLNEELRDDNFVKAAVSRTNDPGSDENINRKKNTKAVVDRMFYGNMQNKDRQAEIDATGDKSDTDAAMKMAAAFNTRKKAQAAGDSVPGGLGNTRAHVFGDTPKPKPKVTDNKDGTVTVDTSGFGNPRAHVFGDTPTTPKSTPAPAKTEAPKPQEVQQGTNTTAPAPSSPKEKKKKTTMQKYMQKGRIYGKKGLRFAKKNPYKAGGIAALALGGLALGNRKRIANGIAALRGKLHRMQQQRKYDKSGVLGKAIIKVQQMIEKLTNRLHNSK